MLGGASGGSGYGTVAGGVLIAAAEDIDSFVHAGMVDAGAAGGRHNGGGCLDRKQATLAQPAESHPYPTHVSRCPHFLKM